jgi:hypothetical protein
VILHRTYRLAAVRLSEVRGLREAKMESAMRAATHSRTVAPAARKRHESLTACFFGLYDNTTLLFAGVSVYRDPSQRFA